MLNDTLFILRRFIYHILTKEAKNQRLQTARYQVTKFAEKRAFKRLNAF